MKKFCIVILSNILFLLVLVLILSINLGEVVNKNIINGLIKNTVINESTNVLINDNDTDREKIEDIKRKLRSNKNIDSLTLKYADITMDQLSGKDIDDINLSQDIKTIIMQNKNIIEDELEVKISDEDLNRAVDEANKNGELTKKYKEAIKNTKTNLSDEAVSALKIYNTIIKVKFQLFVILGIIIVCILLAVIKKSLYKWLFNLGMSSLISSVLNVLLFTVFILFINLSLDSVNNSFTISIVDGIIFPLMVLSISIILLIVYRIIDKKVNKSH